MAKRLEEFPEKRALAGSYPWDEWLDGSAWLLRKGEDYVISSESMRSAISRAAKRRGQRARTTVTKDEDGTEAVAVQAY